MSIPSRPSTAWATCSGPAVLRSGTFPRSASARSAKPSSPCRAVCQRVATVPGATALTRTSGPRGVGQIAGELQHGSLAHAVRDRRTTRAVGGDGGDVDDRTRGFAQRGREGAGAAEGPDDVDVQQFVPDLIAEPVQVALGDGAGGARVVDQYVHPPEPLQHIAGEGPYGRVVGHVRGSGHDLAARFLHITGQRVRGLGRARPARRDAAHTGSRESEGRRPSDAGAAAGDDGDLVPQIHHAGPAGPAGACSSRPTSVSRDSFE